MMYNIGETVMGRQIRKQIYIHARQERLLKRQAKRTALSEAEIIRRALDEHFQKVEAAEARAEAWRRVDALIAELMAQGPAAGRRTWRREALYDRTD
jgi:hypothetical protein